MKLKVIACEVILREICHAAAGAEPAVDIIFNSINLHSTPDELRVELQKQIDATGTEFDAVVLGYGLCSRGTAGLVAGSIPLVIPRAHDCITFLMGSKERYKEEFFANPGTYYYSSGWVERSEGKVDQGKSGWFKDTQRDERYQEYVEKYGEENAQFLIDLEGSWLSHYSRATFIDLGIGDSERYRKFTRKIADEHDWEYRELEGSTRIFHELLSGNWNPEEFLIVPPGETVADTNDDQIITSRP